MAKVDHLKNMQGKFLKGERTNSQKKKLPRGESFRKKLTLTVQQKQLLQKYIECELDLYNHYVENLQSRIKRDHSFFTNLNEKQRILFGLLSREAFNVIELNGKNSTDVQLPDYLEPYRDILFGISSSKQLGMTEKLQFFYELCSRKSSVLKDTRENMAHELLEFFVTQAKNLSNKIQTVDGPQYKNPPEFLEKVTNLQKRHLQIPKHKLKIEYDEKLELTKITLPYFSLPIIIEDDLREMPDWTLAIIHKDPNRLPIGTDLDWEIDFRNVQNKYLVKYLESANPNSQFVGRFLGLKI